MIAYQFQFGLVFAHLDILLVGAWQTIWMSALAIACGFMLAVGFALALRSGSNWLRLAIVAFIEIFRNTPFLAQLFFIYLGLPQLNVRLTPVEAGLIAMSLNGAAYLTEIVRAGLESIHRSQIEAGQSLGLSDTQIFFNVILAPAFLNVYPALQSQFTLIMLGSSIASSISVPELTSSAGFMEAHVVERPFEIYLVIGAIYFVIALALEWLLKLIVRALGLHLVRGRE